jgi:hypothetical protein
MKRNIAVSISLLLVLLVSACKTEANDSGDLHNSVSVDRNQLMTVEPEVGINDSQGDERLPRADAQVYEAELLIMESYPVQVSLLVSGTLLSPCYDFGFEVSEPNADNQIFVEVYSVEVRDTCDMMVQPFNENISLSVAGLPDGVYKVFVNGELVGEFSYPA